MLDHRVALARPWRRYDEMPIIDFETLSGPVPGDTPCGADLELSSDPDYMSFVARAEGALPASFFSGRDESGNTGLPFDRSSIDFVAQFEAAKPLIARTRDLRLLALLSKFSVLDRDLDGFEVCLRAIAALISNSWDDVHPRGEAGDFGLRTVVLESLDDLPTVIMPLQFAPLFESRRFGPISLRSYLIALGEIKAREGETGLDLATIEKTLDEVDLATVRATQQLFHRAASALADIQQVARGRGASIALEKLPPMVNRALDWLNGTLAKRDPAAFDGATTDGAAGPAEDGAAGAVRSAAHAASALAAVAGYFSRFEPSNPALLLVGQARELIGKSFLEVMHILVPAHVEQATIGVGREQFFELPVERLSKFVSTDDGASARFGQNALPIAEPETGSSEGGALPVSASEAQPGGEKSPEAVPSEASTTGGDNGQPTAMYFGVRARAEALALLEQVGSYYRRAEPSSPIPFLTERARDLAQRDFLSVLKALLPENTLKTLNPNG